MAEQANKVRFGLSNVHVVPIVNGEYSTPIKVPGAVNLTTSPEGETTKMYADNIAYFSAVTNAGYTGDLEMALIPDEVKVAIGLGVIDKNGAFVEDADIIAKPFGLLYEVMGDARNRRNVFYNVTAARPEEENKTKEDSTEVTTEKLSITMIPRAIDGRNITKLSIEPTEANKTAYDGFYTNVLEPDFTESV